MAGVQVLSGPEYEYIVSAIAKYTAFSDIKTALSHVDGDWLDDRELELSMVAYKRMCYADPAGFGETYEGWAKAYWNVLTPAPLVVYPTTLDTAGGEEFIVIGSLFPPGCTVEIGGEAATVVSHTGGHILCISPALAAAADNDVTVTNPFNDEVGTVTPGPATAKKTPVFTSISPAVGPLAGGQVCHIVGEAFTPGMVVTIGGHACKVLSETATDLFIRTPAHAAGALDVVVTAVNADADTGTGAYTYSAHPHP